MNWRRALHSRRRTCLNLARRGSFWLLLAPWFVRWQQGFVCNWPIPISHCPCQPLFASPIPSLKGASLLCRPPLRSKESSVSDLEALECLGDASSFQSKLAPSSAKQEHQRPVIGATRCHHADASTCCRQPARIKTAAGPPRPFSRCH